MLAFLFSALGCCLSIGGYLDLSLLLGSYGLLLGLSFNLSESLKLGKLGLLLCLGFHEVWFNALRLLLGFKLGSIFFGVECWLWTREETISLLWLRLRGLWWLWHHVLLLVVIVKFGLSLTCGHPVLGGTTNRRRVLLWASTKGSYHTWRYTILIINLKTSSLVWRWHGLSYWWLTCNRATICSWVSWSCYLRWRGRNWRFVYIWPLLRYYRW